MKPKEINVGDLLDLLGVTSYRDLKDMLKIARLPLPPRKKQIGWRTAEEIVFALRKQRIDWHDFHQKRAKDNSPTIFTQTRLPDLLPLADAILNSSELESKSTRICGVAFRGGFLEDDDGGPFVFALHSRINLVIGDRGSGKSTLLNLLTGLNSSQYERSKNFVSNVLTATHSDAEKPEDQLRRYISRMRDLSVDSVVFVYIHDGRIHALAIDVTQGWALYERVNDDWSHVKIENSLPFPRIYFLQQGDVFRLADVTDLYAFNKLFDTLDQNLERTRKDLGQLTDKIKKQFSSFDVHRPPMPFGFISGTTGRIKGQLRSIRRDFESGESSGAIRERLRSLVNQYSTLDQDYSDFKTVDLFQDEQGIYAIWLGPNRTWLMNFFGMARTISMVEADSAVIGVEPYRVAHESEVEVDDTSTEYEVSEALDRLESMLNVVSALASAYGRAPVPTLELRGLTTSFFALMDARFGLMQNQKAACDASNIALAELMPVNFRVEQSEELPFGAREELLNKSQLLGLINISFDAVPYNRPRLVLDALKAYTSYVVKVLGYLRELGTPHLPSEYADVCDKIAVDLRQGNLPIPFHQLSFGQKSAIILGLALTATKADMIVLDQPEDNLDTSGVVSILVPLIERLSQGPVAVIATHSSNLVMAFRECTLYTLASVGDHAVLGQCGDIMERLVIREMLRILEGGIDPFHAKLQMYQDFVTRVSGAIKDMDVAVIERLFRNMTIQGLTHFLNPLVTDSELLQKHILEVAKHETKPQDRLHLLGRVAEVEELIKMLETSGRWPPEYWKNINSLIIPLKRHVARIDEAIKEVRLLDTRPTPASCNIYEHFWDVVRSVLVPLVGGGRRIRVDLDKSLRLHDTNFDPKHLRLVIRNLMENCLNATGKRARSAFMEGKEYVEEITLSFRTATQTSVTITLADNGIGMASEVAACLYKRRVSTRVGSFRGLGGLIISKLLEINNGQIRLVSTCTKTLECGTCQEITLVRGKEKVDEKTHSFG